MHTLNVVGLVSVSVGLLFLGFNLRLFYRYAVAYDISKWLALGNCLVLWIYVFSLVVHWYLFSDFALEMGILVTSLTNKDLSSVRKWVSGNLDNDPSKMYRKLYDTFLTVMKPGSVPQMIITLAKYQYQAAFVADHELNMLGCLTEIMADCQFQ